MATKRKYGYYIKGNKIAIIEEGLGSGLCSLSGYSNQTTCEAAGGTWTENATNSSDGEYRSPLATVADGLEIELFGDIFFIQKVILKAEANGINAEGNSMDIFLNDEKIIVRGLDSKLYLENTTMLSDGTIEVNNKEGVFTITGSNSSMTSDDINITGENIDGQFSTIDGNKEVIKLNVKDEKISNIKTNDVDMYANKAIYDKKNSIIELFENVKVIRGNEIITGDYGTLDTDTNSYKVKSNNSKKVKVIITEKDE